ncbi:MAG: YdcF family protein [Firmicutes bacterium]|nr:YdcF family protein [Bacillota bacterium]
MIVVLVILISILVIYYHYFPAIPKKKEHYEYGLLLGCPSHNDGSYANSQIKRCELAIQDYYKGKYNTLVITGGAVQNQYVESLEMKKYILERVDIPILCETESRNTVENFQFSKRIIGEQSVLILTSGTHARRACAIAKDYFKDYSADYYYYARPRHIFREIGARYLYIRDKIQEISS